MPAPAEIIASPADLSAIDSYAMTSRHVEPRASTAEAVGATMGASSPKAEVVGCREHRGLEMQRGRALPSDIGSSEVGRGSESAPRRNAMVSLAATSPCAASASANAMGAGC